MGSMSYSPTQEAERIFNLLCEQAADIGLPPNFAHIKRNVVFESEYDRVYFPIPFKETETASALKGIEGGVALALEQLRSGKHDRKVKVNLEKATCFLFQAYMATVGGLGKQDEGVKVKLKGRQLGERKVVENSMLIPSRYGSSSSAVESISEDVGKSL